jgi:hypothetical protein
MCASRSPGGSAGRRAVTGGLSGHLRVSGLPGWIGACAPSAERRPPSPSSGRFSERSRRRAADPGPAAAPSADPVAGSARSLLPAGVLARLGLASSVALALDGEEVGVVQAPTGLFLAPSVLAEAGAAPTESVVEVQTAPRPPLRRFGGGCRGVLRADGALGEAPPGSPSDRKVSRDGRLGTAFTRGVSDRSGGWGCRFRR